MSWSRCELRPKASSAERFSQSATITYSPGRSGLRIRSWRMFPGTVLMTSAAFSQALSNSCSRPGRARMRSSVRTVSVAVLSAVRTTAPTPGPPVASTLGIYFSSC